MNETKKQVIENCEAIRENLRRTNENLEKGVKAVQDASEAVAEVDAKIDRHIARLEHGEDEVTPVKPFPIPVAAKQ